MTSVGGIDGCIWRRQLVDGREDGGGAGKTNIYYQARRQERLSDEGPEDSRDTRGLSSKWLVTTFTPGEVKIV